MPGYHSKEFNPEPVFSTDDCSPKPSTELPPSLEVASGCRASIQICIEPQPTLETLSQLPCSATPAPFTRSSGGPDCMGYPTFYQHILRPADPYLRPDPIAHSYGQNRESPKDNGSLQHGSFQHDVVLLKEYIQSNSRLSAQLSFMKNQRKKKQSDFNLVEDYRFIVYLYSTFKALELKPPPYQNVSSKAILTCLEVTASLLSRARQVVKLLNKIGPDGTSPDPLVIRRLQSKVVVRKGSDLLTFLKQQDRAAAPKDLHTNSP